jgi:hypothetical protein
VAQVNDVWQGSEPDDHGMGQLAGCATFGRYLVLALLGGLTLAVLYLTSSSGRGPLVPQNGGATRERPTPGGIPVVSNRHFESGSAHGVAVGDLGFDLSLPIDRDKAYAQDGLAWIAFGAPGDPDAILVSLDEPENSVAISRGGETALGVGGQCQFSIAVTGDAVSGTISCVEADALRGGTKVGHVSIDVSFTAGS